MSCLMCGLSHTLQVSTYMISGAADKEGASRIYDFEAIFTLLLPKRGCRRRSEDP